MICMCWIDECTSAMIARPSGVADTESTKSDADVTRPAEHESWHFGYCIARPLYLRYRSPWTCCATVWRVVALATGLAFG